MTEPQNEDMKNQSATEGSSAAANGAAADSQVDTIESLRAQLQAALAEKEDNFRGWQRAQADYANFRRRADQEREDLIKGGEAALIMHLLPVLDDLERALAGLPAELRGLTWVDGVLLIERKLRNVLDVHGLTPIDAIGQPFDPHQHEAVMRDGDAGDATTVIAELQRGYRLHDRVLRPTLVKVGPSAHTENN